MPCTGQSGTPARKDLCDALASGPAIVMMKVYGDFGCSVGEEYVPAVHAPNSDLGRHALAVVAFDPHHPDQCTPDGTPAFRVLNSWGTQWGAEGFTWISAASLFGDEAHGDNLVTEIHQFVPHALWLCPPRDRGTNFPPGWVSDGNVGWTGDPTPQCCDVCGLPGADDPSVLAARASRQPRWIELERAAGARAQIVAPAVPLVPARLDSIVRYYVDGRRIETSTSIDPAQTGFAFRFVDRAGTGAQPLKRSSPDDGSNSSSKVKKPPADSGIGADPTAIGAFIDRAIFEIVDPNHPSLAGDRIVRVLVEVYDPGATEPRAANRYRIHIPR
jgi:hypothetical protein